VLLAGLSFSSCEDVLDLLSDDPRDAFVGSWSVEEINTLKVNDPVYYEVSINKSSTDSATVFISNFYEIGANSKVEAIVTGGDIDIPNQTVSSFTIQGSGSIALNDKSITWSYSVDHGNGFIDYCSATFTKP
jgi:hypothetical protein